MSVLASAYTATWNALAIGNTEIGGFRDRYSWKGKEVKFDAVGDTPVDVIFGGLAVFIDFVCEEYDSAAIATMTWPLHAVRGTTYAAGKSMWSRAYPLVLTACDAAASPATITYHKTILAPGYDLERNMEASVERKLPMRLMVLPVKYNASGYTTPTMPDGCSDIVYFTETEPAP